MRSPKLERLNVHPGDRVVFLGDGQMRGKHADALSVREQFSGIRLDNGEGVLVLTRHIHAIPRRPKPDF